MNNLHRELAPISDAAWAQIEEEVARTFKRNLAARRVVDFEGPSGPTASSVGTGHLKTLAPPAPGIEARQHIVRPLVELRVPFELSREAIDDVERGSNDSDWQPAKDAAEKLALAEDRMVFLGYKAAAIDGMRAGSSNPQLTLPDDVTRYPDVVAQALKQLRLVGVDGPYTVLLGAEAYTALSEGNDGGYPVLKHINTLVDGGILWAPALEGAIVLSKRGGDFEIRMGRDLSIGYSSHTDSAVRLYLEESLTFLLHAPEAAVALVPGGKARRA
ncbi:MAG TPA: family 1 encapsulin nanocompartment shell protein [Burkholderiaceae bacterium]|jgi:uncharacterized linocin/CFP29 family protein|nr:family 1 encapsulin nanocompartment shell protein [Burkholderiaceae bacterium]